MCARRERALQGEEGGCGAKLNQPFDCAGCHPSAVDQNNMVHCNCTHKHGQRTPRNNKKRKTKVHRTCARAENIYFASKTRTRTPAPSHLEMPLPAFAVLSLIMVAPAFIVCNCVEGSERWGRSQIASVPKAVDKGVLQHDSTQEGGNHAECTKRVVPALGCVQTAYAHESLTAILSCFGCRLALPPPPPC